MQPHNHPGVYEAVAAIHEARIDSAKRSMIAARAAGIGRIERLRSDRSPLRFAANLFDPLHQRRRRLSHRHSPETLFFA